MNETQRQKLERRLTELQAELADLSAQQDELLNNSQGEFQELQDQRHRAIDDYESIAAQLEIYGGGR